MDAKTFRGKKARAALRGKMTFWVAYVSQISAVPFGGGSATIIVDAKGTEVLYVQAWK
jgi:hypothetical protein